MKRENQLCKRITIVARGDESDDLDLAIDDALKWIRDGNTSGGNSNETGGYYFKVDDVEDKKEWPR